MQIRGDVKRKREPAPLVHGQRPRPLRLLTTFASTSPKGRGLGKEMKFSTIPSQALPGEQTLSVIAARCQLPRRGSFLAITETYQMNDKSLRQCCQAPPSGELASGSETERVPLQRRAFAESGAANAVFLYDPSREKGFQESPQTFLKPKIKNILSAEYAQSKAERIQIVFLRTPPQRPDAPARRTAMPRRTGSPP